MFRTPNDGLRSWLARVDEALDDVLGDPFPTEPPHPHRVPLRWSYARRAGSVTPRPAHCISPVHPVVGSRKLDRAAR